MGRDASKAGYFHRGFLTRPFRTSHAKIALRWAVIGLCLLFWLALLFVFLV